MKVTYKDQKPLLLTIDEAVAAKSFFDPQAKTLKKGDPDSEYNHQSDCSVKQLTKLILFPDRKLVCCSVQCLNFLSPLGE